jgi:hypothetical protein
MVDLQGIIDKVIFHLEAFLKTVGSLLRPLQDDITMFIFSFTGLVSAQSSLFALTFTMLVRLYKLIQ